MLIGVIIISKVGCNIWCEIFNQSEYIITMVIRRGNYVINDTGTSPFYMDDETKEVREFKNYNGSLHHDGFRCKTLDRHNPKNQFRVSTWHLI